MLPFCVTISASVLQRSEIPEGLMNYPVFFGDDIFQIESIQHLGPCKKNSMYMQVTFHPRDMFLKNIAQIKHKISIYSNVFPGG
jgi:hypothetical protein